MKINPYLCLPGTAAEALKFYSQVFKTEPDAVSYFKDIPPGAGMEITEANKDLVMHASIKVGDNLFMISDTPNPDESNVNSSNLTQISIHPDSREDADRVFTLLQEGGVVIMPMADAFWGDYFGMVKDRFGINWMINFSDKY